MAMVTEMTLALGRTVYGGDQSGEVDSDERIEGRETRLSVTWRLTEEEQDLTLIASVLAEEAERALRQTERTVRMGASPVESSNVEKRSDVNDAPKSEADMEQRQPTTAVSVEGNRVKHERGTHTGNGSGHSPEHSLQPAGSSPPAFQATHQQNGGEAPMANGLSGFPVYVPPITKPQQLAIHSHCTRHSVADWELRRLLWEKFGKNELLEMNKDQAGELLTELQRDLLTSGAESSPYAN